jgi:hypothetical protein
MFRSDFTHLLYYVCICTPSTITEANVVSVFSYIPSNIDRPKMSNATQNCNYTPNTSAMYKC